MVYSDSVYWVMGCIRINNGTSVHKFYVFRLISKLLEVVKCNTSYEWHSLLWYAICRFSVHELRIGSVVTTPYSRKTAWNKLFFLWQLKSSPLSTFTKVINFLTQDEEKWFFLYLYFAVVFCPVLIDTARFDPFFTKSLFLIWLWV